mgnify:CR=1 FL=1
MSPRDVIAAYLTENDLEFEELADSLGVRDRLHIVPPVPSTQVVSYLSTANVGVHPLLPGSPNHEMALPNKLFEYLHAGLPVVVSDCTAQVEFLEEHPVGLVHRAGDAHDLARAVTDVLADRTRYAQRCTDPELLDTFSWEGQERALLGVYQGLLPWQPVLPAGQPFAVPAEEPRPRTDSAEIGRAHV